MVVEKEGLFGFRRVAPGKIIWPDGSITNGPDHRKPFNEAARVIDNDTIEYRADYLGAGMGNSDLSGLSAYGTGFFIDRVFEGEEINEQLTQLFRRVQIRWRPG